MMPIPAGSRYVAMGSSFAAGPGLPSRVPGSPRRAGRSTGNYAHLVARALSLDLHDVTFSGATTGDILGPSAAGQPAQLDAVTPDTVLVTITAGGNDVGFVPRLTLASLPWPLRALPRVRARVSGRGDREPPARPRPGLPGSPRRLPDNPAVGRPRPRGAAGRHRGVGAEDRRPARGHDTGGRQRRRLGLCGRLGRIRRSPCLVSDAVDAALPPVPAWGRPLPPQRGRHDRGR
jgi:hypothetical protein